MKTFFLVKTINNLWGHFRLFQMDELMEGEVINVEADESDGGGFY